MNVCTTSVVLIQFHLSMLCIVCYYQSQNTGSQMEEMEINLIQFLLCSMLLCQILTPLG